MHVKHYVKITNMVTVRTMSLYLLKQTPVQITAADEDEWPAACPGRITTAERPH
jgi:hypothetical protein